MNIQDIINDFFGVNVDKVSAFFFFYFSIECFKNYIANCKFWLDVTECNFIKFIINKLSKNILLFYK